MSPAPENLQTSLALLADPDRQRREAAAREVFRQGCATVEPALAQWFANHDFRALLGKENTLLTVGVAVNPERFEAIRAACGNPRLADVPPDQDALEFTLAFPHGVRLDVLTTRDPAANGAIGRFLARFGEGIQQVECDLHDVDRATAILRDRFGLSPIYPETRAGADGTRVNFFLVPLRAGRGASESEHRNALIELVETPGSPRSSKRRPA